MTDDDLARACAAAMWAQDVASQRLGMVLEDVGPGRAVLSMTITPDMVNGHGTAHGGFIFALADSAFAFACNTVDQRSVGQHAAITYLAPARAGDRLTATATERARQGRSGLYDVTVTGADGTLIAEFRGHSRTVKGRILAD
ncbi:MAG: hydroxyphenylacetyl-CoA thioesterase PaaI [Paracoccus hibiscisoli]|uniref:hydroxyphenylacetyl-CoA thioesterase PaaI n=1 Tax=Paracoccus hibiscisoli TaxID=2023261 RepID=UPI003919E3D3